jgi:hypothetical protein
MRKAVGFLTTAFLLGIATPEQEEDGKPVARMVVYEPVTGP